MEKLSKFKDVFNRENLKKGVKIMALGTVLALTPMAFTGCQQPTGGEEQTPTVIPTPTPDPNPEEYTFYTENLGYGNSGISIYKWYQRGVDQLGIDGAAYRNKAVNKYGAYINQQVDTLNELLSNSDDATKNYLKTYIDGLMQNTYTGDNLDQTFDTVYNGASYIFTDLIEASEYYEDGIDICFSLEAISNEAYIKSGLDSNNIRNTYNDKVNRVAGDFAYGTTGMSKTDAERDIKGNNCGEIITLLKNQLINAALRLNTQKGLNLTFDQVVQIVNITISARSMHSIHDYYEVSSENYLHLETNMENFAVNSTKTNMPTATTGREI